jgi:ribonuclease HII
LFFFPRQIHAISFASHLCFRDRLLSAVRRKLPTVDPKTGKTLSPSAAKLRLLKRLKCTLKFEKLAWASGAKLVAGVDEVGRGSLFGPVVAAACILDPGYRIRGLRDSKLLPEPDRDSLYKKIRDHCVAYAVGAVDVARIDQINIYHASRLAMKLAVSQLPVKPDHLLIDAMKIEYECPQTKIIHGDALSASIAAASILAKVERDAMIRAWDPVYPAYGLASNKGYSTPKHLKTLRELGPSPLHRQSFAPVWNNAPTQELMAFMEEEEAATLDDGAEPLTQEMEAELAVIEAQGENG